MKNKLVIYIIGKNIEQKCFHEILKEIKAIFLWGSLLLIRQYMFIYL